MPSNVRFADQLSVSAFGNIQGNAISASYAESSSFASYATSASYAISASHEIVKEVSSSHADTASFAQSGDGVFSGSFSGSFEGNGSGLTDIPASGIVGLNLSQIASGSATASISPNGGLYVNTNITSSNNIAGKAFYIKDGGLTSEALGAVPMNSQLNIASSTNYNKIFINNSTSNAKITTYGDVSSSAASTASFGTYLGDGSQLSGISTTPFPFSGSAVITGSLTVTGSSGTTVFLVGPTNNEYLQLGSNANNRIELSISADPLDDPDKYYISYQGSDANTATLGLGASEVQIGDIEGHLNQVTLDINSQTPSFNFVGAPITASNNFSSSISSTASFGTYLGDGSQLTGIISSSYAISASYAVSASHEIIKEVSSSYADTASFAQSGNGTFSGSFSGSYVGDGSGLTGVDPFPFSGSAVITGSLVVSGSSKPVEVIGSGSTVFSVVGSLGELFAIDDVLSGSLLVINDSSGIPQFEVFSDGRTLIGADPRSLYTTATISATAAATSESIYSLSTSSYDGVFFDYTISSASNARAGNIMSIWNGGSLVYTENTTTDIGSTTGVNFDVIISQSQAQLISVTDTAGWKIKTTIRSI